MEVGFVKKSWRLERKLGSWNACMNFIVLAFNYKCLRKKKTCPLCRFQMEI
jgi:hypothetical protein